MADDNRFRSNRPTDPYRHGGASRPSADGSDPLTELARLIGKSDPYAAFGRSAPQDDRHAADDFERTGAAGDHWRGPQGYGETYHEHDDSRAVYGARGEVYRGHSDEVCRGHSDPAPHDERGWRSGGPGEDHEARFDAYSPAQPHAQPPAHDQHEREQYSEQQYSDEYFADGSAAEPHEEQIYDDPPRVRRYGGLPTVLALIGCAMLGTAGAYAYRSYYGPGAAMQTPRVITADTSVPAKIVPAVSGDAQPGKVIQDRVANAGREQIVSKQEEPVALRDLGTQTAPRVVLPAPVAPTSAASATPAGPQAATPPASTDPKKVRTVTVRPDGTTTVPAVAPRAGAAPATRGGPLSLDPQAAELPTAAPRTRTAAAPTSPARSASDGFLVQLSSQKTEAEANASFRSLQAKFPNELGGRSHVIQRADLGAKGVFYRAMVGPFGSLQEATQFCAGYKAAGGHCVVPNN
jgi:sporulation related protein